MSAIPESFVSNISIRERLTGIEKRLGKGEISLPPESKAILPIRVLQNIYKVTTEYSNDDIRKMSDKDFASLKAKLYSIIYRNVFLKKEKPKTKSIVVQIVSGDSKSLTP